MPEVGPALAELAEGRAALRWGFKSSFLKYLARTPGTQVSVGDGAAYVPSNEFHFPAADDFDALWDGSHGSLQFDGDIQFLGHGGMMLVVLARPRIDVQGLRTTLSFADRTRGQDDLTNCIVVADLTWSLPSPRGHVDTWHTVPAVLADSGVEVFNDIYPSGQRMADVRVHVPW